MNIDKMTLPLIRKVYPSLIANQLVGVQPMTGPSSIPFTLIPHEVRERIKRKRIFLLVIKLFFKRITFRA